MTHYVANPGSCFFTSYYMYHKDNVDCKIFLLGAKEGIAAKSMERIYEKVGRTMDGTEGTEEEH